MRIHIEEYFKIKHYAKQAFEHVKSAWYWDTLVCKWLTFQTIAPIQVDSLFLLNSQFN